MGREISRPHTTIQGWQERDHIPRPHRPNIKIAAERLGFLSKIVKYLDMEGDANGR